MKKSTILEIEEKTSKAGKLYYRVKTNNNGDLYVWKPVVVGKMYEYEQKEVNGFKDMVNPTEVEQNADILSELQAIHKLLEELINYAARNRDV